MPDLLYYYPFEMDTIFRSNYFIFTNPFPAAF
jgi:hypothetical protein